MPFNVNVLRRLLKQQFDIASSRLGVNIYTIYLQCRPN